MTSMDKPIHFISNLRVQAVRSCHSASSRSDVAWTRPERRPSIRPTIQMAEGFDPAETHSLNHACTLLSECCEQHRCLHTVGAG